MRTLAIVFCWKSNSEFSKSSKVRCIFISFWFENSSSSVCIGEPVDEEDEDEDELDDLFVEISFEFVVLEDDGEFSEFSKLYDVYMVKT